jgi:site-specific DNA recombinase
VSTQPATAALYARVSTARQAEADLSIPDQVRQAEAFCARKGLTLVETFIEAGASGMDEDRPEFQRMIDRATGHGRPYAVIIVHSLSRFFRDAMFAELYTRRLRKAGVQLVSMTQDFADDTTGDVVRKILNVFDEYQSRENAKHTSRAMNENARQGFWNGSHPPFGYRTVEAERRGTKAKKVLAIDEAEAAQVRHVFDLYLGSRGLPLGVKAIATTLNDAGITYRGKPFATSNVHRMLTQEAYVGTHWFNVRDSRTRLEKPRTEWVALAVPPLLDPAVFQRVQARLAANAPCQTPPRLVNNPTLLTGLAVCAACGGGMTMRTGKHGQYRYYTCALRAQKSVRACEGCTVPMDPLDQRVVSALADRVFEPSRLKELLADHLTRAQDSEASRRQQVGQLKGQLTEVEGSQRRLIQAIEQGVLDLSDPDVKPRIEALRARRTLLQDDLARASASPAPGQATLTPEKLARLSTEMTRMLHEGPAALRKAYLRLFVDKVVVSRDEIRLSGPTAALARAAMAPPADSPGEVLTFVREWRPRRDSNPCYSLERAVS